VYGVALRAGIAFPISVLLSLILSPFFETSAQIIANGPEGPTGLVYTAVATLANVYLLTLVLSIMLMVIGGAAAEGRLGRF